MWHLQRTIEQYQPPRLLLIWNSDLTVSFLDISAGLLLGIRPDPIKHNFPNRLDPLDIDVSTTCANSTIAKHISREQRITQVLFASEALDCAVLLSTGVLLVYHFQPGRVDALPYRESESERILVLDHVMAAPGSAFWPGFLVLPPPQSSSTTFSLCDTGIHIHLHLCK